MFLNVVPYKSNRCVARIRLALYPGDFTIIIFILDKFHAKKQTGGYLPRAHGRGGPVKYFVFSELQQLERTHGTVINTVTKMRKKIRCYYWSGTCTLVLYDEAGPLNIFDHFRPARPENMVCLQVATRGESKNKCPVWPCVQAVIIDEKSPILL